MPHPTERALAAIRQGDWAQAEQLLRTVLAAQPGHFDALHLLGFIAIQTGRAREAVTLLSRAASINPNDAELFNNLGVALDASQRHAEAVASFDRTLALKPGQAQACFNRGNAQAAMRRHVDAVQSFELALTLKPDFSDAYNNCGNALYALRRYAEAIQSYDRGLALKPDAESFYNRGNALRALKRHADAVASYGQAIALSPNHADAHNNRGNALRDLGRDADALESFERSLAIRPDARVWNNRGNALRSMKRYAEALASYESAIVLKPDLAEAYVNRGNLQRELGHDGDALASYDAALAIEPAAGTYFNRGNVLRDRKRLAEALASYESALRLDPGWDYLFGIWLHTRMRICDWADIGAHFNRLNEGIARREKVSMPFSVLAISDSPEVQRIAAAIWVEDRHPTTGALPPTGRLPRHDKVRLGYFSADFHEHATAQLIVELLERHDRSKFELTAFSFGPVTDDAMRGRVSAAFDAFVDVRDLTDKDVATLARTMEIDIAVDLKGFTQNSRTGIFALRAAPMQVSYLGYPGTMGADYIDYLIADATLIPPDQREHYAEKIVTLPHSYQVNDRQRVISDATSDREASGLPGGGFVFCCFNSSYKILPQVFDCWMRILNQVEGSVLWLLQDNAWAAGNLRNEASRRGIDAGRLIFAQPLPLPEHLARHRLADLFLDTLPCNAHTTGSDALWAGLPVLTCLGGTFAGRVAASLLNAIRLPELITGSLAEYEALAIHLARNAGELRGIRQELADNRLSTPLFDSALFAKHIEAAYMAMYERCQSGLAPEHIHVQALDAAAPTSQSPCQVTPCSRAV